jgi:adenylate cyclase
VLVRRRWPLPVLLISAAAIQLYGLSNYPGIFPAVPLSVAVATAWVAGYRRWTPAVVIWFVLAPLMCLMQQWSEGDEPLAPLLNGIVQSAAMFAAVLLFAEAVRSRQLLQAEQQRSEQLLLNILSAPVADRLKQGEQVIADRFPEVTVRFADLVVGGLPNPRPHHAAAVAEMALAVREEVPRHLDPVGRPLAVRIGVDTGPVVAGVIGRRKFSHDLWGDTVNTASRMESRGVAGCIQVTDRAYRRLRDRYRFERRGPVRVKGTGPLVTWFLVGRDPQPR